MNKFPTASRTLEYVAFLDFKVSTGEGPAHVFVAVDAFTEFAFNLAVEKEKTPETILKNIYFLLEHPDFAPHNTNGFTLVLQEYEDLEERIIQVIKPEGGKVLYNKAYNNYVAGPLLESLAGTLGKIRL